MTETGLHQDPEDELSSQSSELELLDTSLKLVSLTRIQVSHDDFEMNFYLIFKGWFL